MAELFINKKVIENVNNDDLIKILNDIIDEEINKEAKDMDCTLVDECVDALIELEKQQNSHFAVLVPLMQDEKFLQKIKSNTNRWHTMGTAARAAIIAAAVMGSTITVNAMVDTVFDYNILEHISSAVNDMFKSTQTLDTAPEISYGEDDDDDAAVTTTKEEITKETTTKANITTTVSNTTTNKTEQATKANEFATEESTTKRVSGDDVHKTTTKNNNVLTPVVNLTGIYATFDNSFKYNYIYGEKLSYEGMNLFATMSDGTEKKVDLKNCLYTTKVNMEKTADINLNIIYKGYLVEINITVRPDEETRHSKIMQNSDYDYLLTSKGAYITAYKGDAQYLDCSRTDVYNIYAIANSVFKNNKNLKSISMPNVKLIADSAFENCTALTEFEAIAAETIGSSAFYGCTALKSADTGNALTTLGKKAYAKTALTSLKLGSNVLEIPSSLCEDCAYLNTVEFNGKVTKIGEYAFAECQSLQRISGTTNITYAGDYAFSNCENVEFDFPKSLQYSGENAFYFCRKLNIGTIPQTMKHIGAYSFAYCPNITEIKIPSGISTVSKGAFKATNAKYIYLNEGVIELEDEAFMSCKFTNITLPSSLAKIGNKSLYNILLQGVVFNRNNCNIDDESFYLSKRLTFTCEKGSSAYLFALNHNVKYKLVNNLPEISDGEDD